MLLWVPIHEQDFGQEMFLPQQPLAALCAGELQPVPYIVSQTQDEFFWKALGQLPRTITLVIYVAQLQ